MQKSHLILFLFSITVSFAQDEASTQIEIDSGLWKPFKAAFENLDAKALNSLYAERVLRVTPNGIDTESNFRALNLKRFAKNKTDKTSVQLDFWFDSRHTNADISYEVGFYKMQLTNEKGRNTVYGQFHIVLQRLKGAWKITQDWDTTTINGNTITASDFEKKPPVEFE